MVGVGCKGMRFVFALWNGWMPDAMAGLFKKPAKNDKIAYIAPSSF